MASGDLKRAAALEAAALVEDGMVLGLGTGSTSLLMVEAVGQRVAQGLKIQAVATSEGIAAQARRWGIPLLSSYPDFSALDLTLDGADEVDEAGRLIKGGGGALLREKLVAVASRRLVIMVDPSKQVARLGQSWPVPVEVVPFGWSALISRLGALGARVELRQGPSGAFVTDHGNFILDCHFGPLEEPEELQRRLKALPGVVETGLFLGLTSSVIVGLAPGQAHRIDYAEAR